MARTFLITAFACLCFAVVGCHAVPKTSCDSLAVSNGDAACDSQCEAYGCDAVGCDAIGNCAAGRRVQVVRGRKIPLLDKTGSFLGVANKLALWDRRADNHDVSPQTETAVVNYLQRNGLHDTLLRVNQYAPIDEWRRMVSNKRIAAPWRYTFGTYDWLKYTLIPGRLVGGDWYNPFSDSLHLYSDISTIGLSKAAYAKDVHNRTWPGTYAAFQDAPMLGLYHETLANRETMQYLRQHATKAEVTQAEQILYPDFAGSIGGQALGFLPYGSVYGRAAGALAGHAVRVGKDRVSTTLR